MARVLSSFVKAMADPPLVKISSCSFAIIMQASRLYTAMEAHADACTNTKDLRGSTPNISDSTQNPRLRALSNK